jgi:DNA mismatch endonuclease, patch repair protein
MDTISSESRSWIMAQVRSYGNKSTEAKIIKIFKVLKIKGWRRNVPLVGKPDFVFQNAKIAFFVDGCFWHGCAKHCRLPSSNRKYWTQKIERNKNRDRTITKILHQKGWQVIRVWEHELVRGKIPRKMNKLNQHISQSECYRRLPTNSVTLDILCRRR